MENIIMLKIDNKNYLLKSENILSNQQIFNIVSLISLIRDTTDINKIIKKISDNLNISLRYIPIIAEIKISHS